MDVTNTFLPIGKELIDEVFPTAIRYLQNGPGSYDPATGEVTKDTTEYEISAGVLSRGRTEDGGVAETQELRLWVHHGTGGLPEIPTTADQVEYQGLVWKVVSVDPTYTSAGLIASKLTARCD